MVKSQMTNNIQISKFKTENLPGSENCIPLSVWNLLIWLLEFICDLVFEIWDLSNKRLIN